MYKITQPARDAFAFSLGGMTSIASFVVAPAIAGDRINRAMDERIKSSRADRKRQNGAPCEPGQNQGLGLGQCA
jgi:hypothetical protein